MKFFATVGMIVALLFGSVPANAQATTQQASTEQSAVETLRITKYVKGLNKPCPKGSDKMFIANATIHKDSLGTYADGDRGVGEIVLRNGRQLNSEDYQVPPDYRVAEYYFFAPSRFAKVMKDPLENSVTVELAGPNMWFGKVTLRKQCLERYGS